MDKIHLQRWSKSLAGGRDASRGGSWWRPIFLWCVFGFKPRGSHVTSSPLFPRLVSATSALYPLYDPNPLPPLPPPALSPRPPETCRSFPSRRFSPPLPPNHHAHDLPQSRILRSGPPSSNRRLRAPTRARCTVPGKAVGASFSSPAEVCGRTCRPLWYVAPCGSIAQQMHTSLILATYSSPTTLHRPSRPPQLPMQCGT